MKRKFTPLVVLFVLSFAACIKTEIPIPPPPPGGSSTSPPTGNIPYGISMYVNGMFSTYNTSPSVDTTENGFNYMGSGDSACCTNLAIAWGMNKFDNTALTLGVYPASGYLDENQSEWTIYSWGNWNYTSNIGFLAFPDTVIITNITDSSITGTFFGTCTGSIFNFNTDNSYDSVMTVTNGKFHLKKW
jgi:hypothetical protein